MKSKDRIVTQIVSVAIALVPLISAGVRAANPDDVVINPDRQSYDIQPSVVVLSDGSSWATWKAYFRSKERVLVRRIATDGSTTEPIIDLSDEPGIVDGPGVFAHPMGKEVWAFWSARIDGRWRIIGRRLSNDRWGDTQLLSSADVDAIKPRALVRADDSVVLAWHEFGADGRSTVRARTFDGRAWSDDTVTVSRAEHDSFRAAPIERDGQVWVFWDEYAQGGYAVLGRVIAPRAGPIERISLPAQPGVRCFKPMPISSATQGLCVAWVKLTDVVGGNGVIDMIHTAHVSVRDENGWRLVRDRRQSDEGAMMISGLLPDMRPGKRYASGYSGRRRHPMLVDGDDGVWMVWERKSEPAGAGTRTYGQLLGRRFSDDRWSDEIVLLYDKLVDYHVASPARVRGGRFFVAGSKLPDDFIRPYHRAAIDLSKAATFTEDDWRDQYRPINLLVDDPSPRHSIEIDGKTYHLYWADMHCHSGLTGDAEGEPDEIVLYGRDRARLDMMVMQDNDDVHGCYLTEGDYYMGMLHSQRFSRGDFLALPGYEWTSRKPRPGTEWDPFRSGFEQRGGSYPNHRTVIYPLRGGPIVRYPEVGNDFRVLAAAVEKAGGIMNTQHRTFDLYDSPAEANIEVTSCWGIYIHEVPEKIHADLDAGWRRGFVGCSDSHRRNPGLCGGITGIYAESLTDGAILDALRKHRCFATNGSKIIIDSRADGRLSDEPANASRNRVTFELFVRGTKPIISATLIGSGGRLVRTYEGDGTNTLKVQHTQRDLPPGEHWFYWEIAQEGLSTQYNGNTSVARGHLAWSSPHFVSVE